MADNEKNSAEYVKTVSSIHSAVVLAAFAILLASQLGSETIRLAKQQFEDIKRIEQVVGDGTPMKELAEKTLSRQGITALADTSDKYLGVFENKPSNDLLFEVKFSGPPGIDTFTRNPQLEPITKFKEFWDNSDESYIYMDLDKCYTATLDSDKTLGFAKKEYCIKVSETSLSNDIWSTEGFEYLIKTNESPPMLMIKVKKDSSKTDVIRVIRLDDLITEDFSMKQVLKEEVKETLSGWQETDTFAKAFPELDKLTQNVQEKSFKQTEEYLNYLNGLEQFSNDPIEILGVKIRPNQLAWFGTLVLLVMQIYLLVHIWALKERLDFGGLNQPWIGIYKNPIAIIVTALSMIFPLFVVGKLLLSTKSLPRSWVLWIVFITTSILTFIVFICLRKKVLSIRRKLKSNHGSWRQE